VTGAPDLAARFVGFLEVDDTAARMRALTDEQLEQALRQGAEHLGFTLERRH
jgi:hypothetical protein